MNTSLSSPNSVSHNPASTLRRMSSSYAAQQDAIQNEARGQANQLNGNIYDRAALLTTRGLRDYHCWNVEINIYPATSLPPHQPGATFFCRQLQPSHEHHTPPIEDADGYASLDERPVNVKDAMDEDMDSQPDFDDGSFGVLWDRFDQCPYKNTALAIMGAPIIVAMVFGWAARR